MATIRISVDSSTLVRIANALIMAKPYVANSVAHMQHEGQIRLPDSYPSPALIELRAINAALLEITALLSDEVINLSGGQTNS